MADGLLIQGKLNPWLVTDLGAAHVVIKASDIPIGGAAPDYAVLYDSVSTTISYLGKALPGTATSALSWQVKRLTFGADGDVTTHYADGNSSFDNIWDNRASLAYS
jgi:hypothetical protein